MKSERPPQDIQRSPKKFLVPRRLVHRYPLAAVEEVVADPVSHREEPRQIGFIWSYLLIGEAKVGSLTALKPWRIGDYVVDGVSLDLLISGNG